MKLLHITHHQGCKINLDYVAKRLGIHMETQFADWSYNVYPDVATEVWNKHKDYYATFDGIITSDTVPLSRIFLQNNYEEPLYIWICNRFDYGDDGNFPDHDYYRVMQDSYKKPNVKIISYTKFEHEYARIHRGINFGTYTIKPCSFHDPDPRPSSINLDDKSRYFFIPPYHNDTIYMNLKGKCDELDIPAYNGRYNGPLDLQGFRGIIHIPYAWSNLALFENWSMGNVYYIPSLEFIRHLWSEPNFFWSPPLNHLYIGSSEWYLPEHENLFIYFNSWDHLRELVQDDGLLQNKKTLVKQFSAYHDDLMLNRWKRTFNL